MPEKHFRKKRTIRRRLILFFVLLLGAALIFFLLADRETELEVRTEVIKKGDIASLLYITAQIEPGAVQEAKVGRQYVQSVYVKVGDEVKKGDPLIAFDLTELEEQLEETRKTRKEAEDAVTEMTKTIEAQANSSQKSLQNIQKTINRLSRNVSRSMTALNNLTGQQPYELRVDEEKLSGIMDRLMTLDRSQPDLESQYKALLDEYKEAITFTQSEAYQNQLTQLQESLNETARVLSDLLANMADPDLLAALSGTSSLSALSSTAASAQNVLIQAIQAEAAAEKALQDAVPTLYAEIDGVVALVDAKPGSYTGDTSVSSSTLPSFGLDMSGSWGSLSTSQNVVAVIYDHKHPKATYQANRYDASRLAVGMPVSYSQDGRDYFGEVTYKSKFATSLDPSGSETNLLSSMGSMSSVTSEPTLTVEMSVKGTDLSALVLGFNIDAVVQTDFAEDALLLPAEAMKKELGQYFVYIVDDGRVYKKEVIPGIQSDTHIQIIEGLTEGMRVVLSPGNDLLDGMKVKEIND